MQNLCSVSLLSCLHAHGTPFSQNGLLNPYFIGLIDLLMDHAFTERMLIIIRAFRLWLWSPQYNNYEAVALSQIAFQLISCHFSRYMWGLRHCTSTIGLTRSMVFYGVVSWLGICWLSSSFMFLFWSDPDHCSWWDLQIELQN